MFFYDINYQSKQFNFSSFATYRLTQLSLSKTKISDNGMRLLSGKKVFIIFNRTVRRVQIKYFLNVFKYLVNTYYVFPNAGLVGLRQLDLERTAVGDDGLDVLSCTLIFGYWVIAKGIYQMHGFPFTIAWFMHTRCCETFGKHKRHEPRASGCPVTITCQQGCVDQSDCKKCYSHLRIYTRIIKTWTKFHCYGIRFGVLKFDVICKRTIVVVITNEITL